MKNAITIALCALALTLAASAASADWMDYNGVGLNETVKLHATGLLADNLTTYAGQEKISYNGQSYNAFCVDLNQYAASGDVTETSTDSLQNGAIVAYLLSEYGGSKLTTGRQAAALGVAIWELVWETSPTIDTTSGRFYVDDAGIAADAMAMINSYNGQIVKPYLVLSSSSVQDFVVDGVQVPEPATLALLGLGGAAAMLKRRRRTV